MDQTNLVSIVGVALALGAILGAVKLFGKQLSPEISRKLVHVAMGLIAMSFPLLFSNKSAVLVLAGITTVALLTLRRVQCLKHSVGSVLHGVNRHSFGEIYYIWGIAIVFSMSQSLVEYLIPIAILTFADSVAALVGNRYGQTALALEQQEDRKSGEGSVMFFVTAYFCTLIPLQLLTEIGRAEVLLIAGIIGLLMAMLETICTDGSDNLLIPLLTHIFLRDHMVLPVGALIQRLIAMAVLLVVMTAVRKNAAMSRLSAAYLLVIGYSMLVLGGIIWIVPPLLYSLTVRILPKRTPEECALVVPHKVLFGNSVVGLLILWLALTRPPAEQKSLYLAFGFAFACHMVTASYHRFLSFLTDNKVRAMLIAVGKAVFFVLLPVLLIDGYRYGRVNLWIAAGFLVCLCFFFVPLCIWLSHRFNYDGFHDSSLAADILAVAFATLLFWGFAG